jgi:hypothetical protein
VPYRHSQNNALIIAQIYALCKNFVKENGVVFEKRMYEKQIVAFQKISVSFLCYCVVLTGREKYAIL